MREYKPNQPKIFCRGVAGYLIIQDDERAMDGGARRVESPMRTGRPCMALFYVDLHESTRAKSSRALSSTHIDSSAFFCGRGSKTSGPHPAIYHRTVLMFQLFREKTWKTLDKKTTPTQKTPVLNLNPPHLCCQTHRTIASRLSLRHAITLLEDLCQQAGWKMWKSLHR